MHPIRNAIQWIETNNFDCKNIFEHLLTIKMALFFAIPTKMLYFCIGIKNPMFKHQQTIMINYKDLGLVNTREMFKRAINGGYAIPAFNFNNMEQLQAIIQASSEKKSPVILQVSNCLLYTSDAADE